MRRLGLALLAFFSLTAAATDTSPRLLIHLLDYVAGDYPGAVADGQKVLSPEEYGEMKEFASALVQGAKTLDASIVDAGILAELEALKAKIEAKASPSEVARAAREVQGRILSRSKIEVAPKRWPDLADGAALFATNCVQCHGAEGRGDGPSSATLTPKPTNFHGDKMPDVSPFQAFNAIRLGVPGTGMAAFDGLSDQQAWALAFFVVSLRHREAARVAGMGDTLELSLETVASGSDRKLMTWISGSPDLAGVRLAKLRNRSEPSAGGVSYLRVAKDRLREALALSEKGDFDGASQAAIRAYLDGVEPVEPVLRAKDNGFVARVEQAMTGVRQSIAERSSFSAIHAKVEAAESVLTEAATLLERTDVSPGFTFGVASGIFLREGFEAILIIVTLLGVIRAIGARRAAWFVHAGWSAALLLSVLLWFFSGWVVSLNTVSREVMEGAISLFAVVVLLYFGFWLHRKVQIQRWRTFLEAMAKTAVEGKKLIGLSLVAFMAVFREAFETILFLRALTLEPGTSQVALWSGVGAAFVVIMVMAVALVRFSVRIPIRQLFLVSSWVVWLLAFVLSGKAVHSFQESGLVSVTGLPWNIRVELMGLYPTWETVGTQVVVLALGGILFYLGNRPPKLNAAAVS